jgi:hypothetical protein
MVYKEQIVIGHRIYDVQPIPSFLSWYDILYFFGIRIRLYPPDPIMCSVIHILWKQTEWRQKSLARIRPRSVRLHRRYKIAITGSIFQGEQLLLVVHDKISLHWNLTIFSCWNCIGAIILADNCWFQYEVHICISRMWRISPNANILADSLTRPNGLNISKGKFYLGYTEYACHLRILPPFRSTRYQLNEFCVQGTIPT